MEILHLINYINCGGHHDSDHRGLSGGRPGGNYCIANNMILCILCQIKSSFTFNNMLFPQNSNSATRAIPNNTQCFIHRRHTILSTLLYSISRTKSIVAKNVGTTVRPPTKNAPTHLLYNIYA